MNKWMIAGIVVVTCVAADQVTKLWAEATLASPRYPDHQVEMVVDNAYDQKTLKEFLDGELTMTSEKDKELIASRFVDRDERPVYGHQIVAEGDKLRFQLKTATIIDGYWDHIYARNPGAAWSIGADMSETTRRAFFVLASLVATIIIIVVIYRLEAGQKLLLWALSLVLAGAIGNMIDRVAYGYVIDFISWHVGDSYWPTFNIADVVICVGVGLMGIEIIRGETKKEDEEDGEDQAEALAEAKDGADADEKSKASDEKGDGAAEGAHA